MYANKTYANKVVKGYHPLLCFGLAKVLGSADRDLLKLFSVRSKWVICSSIFFLNLIWSLKIFFMPFQMEDMNALESVGGGCCQKAGSSSSSCSSSEEDSAGTSSSWTLGVHMACKQLLYAVIHSGAINTRSYKEKTSSGQKFLHKWVTNRIRILCTLSAWRIGDETVEYDRVKADRVMLCYQIMNSLQHRPIERSSMVKAEDIALDPVSNTMNISKDRTGFEPIVLLSASSTQMVMYSIKGRGSLWCGLLGTCM